MKRYARIFLRCLMGVLVVFTAISVFQFDADSAAFAAAATGTPVSNINETSTPDQHKVRDVSDALAVLEPSRFPFDTMMRKLKGRRQGGVKNVKVEWARTDRIPRTDTLSAATAASADGATATWTVSNGHRWRKNDLIALPGNLTTPTMLVEEVVDASAGTLTVRALEGVGDGEDGFGIVPAVSGGDPLARIGNSKTESDSPSDSRAMMPEYDSNLIHTYDAVVEVSDHRRRTSNHTSTDDWKRARQDNLHDLRKSFEYNSFFGQASESTDAGNQENRYTQNGVVRYIPNTINYSVGSMSEGQLIDINKTIFTGNNGAFTRMLFADAGLCTELDKVLLAKMQHAPSRTIAGVTFSELKTRFGRLLVAYHPGFDELGYTNFGVVLDMNNIYKRELQPMKKQTLEYKKTGIKDADAEQYIEKSTTEVRRPDTHFIIEGA